MASVVPVSDRVPVSKIRLAQRVHTDRQQQVTSLVQRLYAVQRDLGNLAYPDEVRGAAIGTITRAVMEIDEIQQALQGYAAIDGQDAAELGTRTA